MPTLGGQNKSSYWSFPSFNNVSSRVASSGSSRGSNLYSLFSFSPTSSPHIQDADAPAPAKAGTNLLLTRHHGSYYSGDVMYVVIFGVMANVIVAAACLTTLAFVRRRTSSQQPSPLLPHHPCNQCSCNVAEEAGVAEASAKKKRQPNAHAVDLAACPPSGANVPPDVYRLLAPAAAGEGILRQQQRQQLLPNGSRSSGSSIPELRGCTSNADVRAMLLSSASVSHFFHQHRSAGAGAEAAAAAAQQPSAIQWELA